MTTKRTRASNFSLNETRLLIDVALSFKKYIENKQTDAVNWKQKNEAWDKIATKFNSISGQIHRDAKTLRLKYDCIKREIKSKKSANKLEIYKTGGGTPNIKPFEDYEEKLLEILSMSIDGLPFTKDSDEHAENSVHNNEIEEQTETRPQSVSKDNLETDMTEFIMDDNNYVTFVPIDGNSNNVTVPTNLNEATSTNKVASKSNWATPNKRKKINNFLDCKYSSIANDREKLIKVQMDNALQEKEYIRKKIIYLEEEHELHMKRIKLEIRERELNLLHKYPNLGK